MCNDKNLNTIVFIVRYHTLYLVDTLPGLGWEKNIVTLNVYIDLNTRLWEVKKDAWLDLLKWGNIPCKSQLNHLCLCEAFSYSSQ
jgi:hypothetical protein